MPAPMVPPPMTAAVRTGFGSTPFSAAGRGAARSAKKTWRSAAASGEARSSRKVSRSKAIAVVEVGLGGAADAGECAERRGLAARRLADPRLGGLPEARLGRDRRAVAQRRGAAGGLPLRRRRRRRAGRRRRRVDQAELQRLRRLHRLAGGDELDGGRRRHQPRQAHRAAGARDDAEGDLRQADRGRRHGHAEAAGERDLEAAAERGAVDRRDPGLRRAPRCAARGRAGAAARGGLPNSLTSAPAMKVRPAQTSTTASTPGSASSVCDRVPERLPQRLRRGRSPAGCRR